jgi:hypothetical protein
LAAAALETSWHCVIDHDFYLDWFWLRPSVSARGGCNLPGDRSACTLAFLS